MMKVMKNWFEKTKELKFNNLVIINSLVVILNSDNMKKIVLIRNSAKFRQSIIISHCLLIDYAIK